MPNYQITNNLTGQKIVVQGTKPPTEEDVQAIFSQMGQKTQNQGTSLAHKAKTVSDFLGLGTLAGNIGSLSLANQGNRVNNFNTKIQQATQQANALTQQAKQLPRGSAQQKALLDQARQIMNNLDTQTNQFNQDLNNRQYLSGVTEKDLGRSQADFITRRAVGQSAELASFLLPQTGALKTARAATRLGRVGQAAGKGLVVGTLQGTAEAARNADTVGEVATDIGKGAVVGATTGAAFQAALEAGNDVKNLIKKFGKKSSGIIKEAYKGTLKNNIADDKFYQQYGGENKILKGGTKNRSNVFNREMKTMSPEDKVVEDAIKYNISPTKNGATKQFNEYKKIFNREMEIATKQMERQNKRVDVSGAYEKAKQKVIDRFGYDEDLKNQALKWFGTNAEKYQNQSNALPKSANKLRIKLDQKVGDVLTSDAVGADAARKAFATELRNAFKNIANSKTKDAIQKYQLLAGLTEAMKKEPTTGIVEAVGAALGRGGVVGNAVGFIGTKAIRSPGLRRFTAGAISNLANSPMSESAVINPLSQSAIAPSVAAIQRLVRKDRQLNPITNR